jgi:hypothetical protein
VVSLNLSHEAKLHTNKEIMVREQEMLLEDIAAFILLLQSAGSRDSSPASSPQLQPAALAQQQQQQQLMQQQQQPGTHGVQGVSDSSGSSNESTHSAKINGLVQVMRGWTVSMMTEEVFPVSVWREAGRTGAAGAAAHGSLCMGLRACVGAFADWR